MIYMDNAATSWPKPSRVYDMVLKTMKEYGANPGRSGHSMAIEAGNILLYTRKILCQLFGVRDPFNMIFTLNATDSLNLAIKGILKEGDHVITTSMEHNSVIRPLMHLSLMGIKTTIVKADPEGMVDPWDIEKAIESNTRLIVTTHGSNVTGSLVPIDEISKISEKHGIYYLVDAAQTAGLLSIDLSKLPVDLVAMPGHKELLGPQGTGVLYIKKGTPLRQIREGGTGSQSESLYQPEFMPDRYESGTINTPGIAGLGAGIKYILEEGRENLSNKISSMEKMFLDQLWHMDGVKVYGPKNMSLRMGIISINIGDLDSREGVTILDQQYNIGARGSLHCAPLAHETIGTKTQGTIRLSPGIFTTKEEVNRCLEAIDDINRKIKTRSL